MVAVADNRGLNQIVGSRIGCIFGFYDESNRTNPHNSSSILIVLRREWIQLIGEELSPLATSYYGARCAKLSGYLACEFFLSGPKGNLQRRILKQQLFP